MCGIAGWFDTAEERPPERAILVAMSNALAHRGPDGKGLYTRPGIGLAHRRLAVIDLETGMQPMEDEGGTAGEQVRPAQVLCALCVKGRQAASNDSGL